MKHLFSTALLAMAGLALGASSAGAAVSYSDGDLILGFHSSTSNEDYEINLGSATQFTAGGIYSTGNAVVISFDELVPSGFLMDLQDAFGGSALKFGIAGVQYVAGNGFASKTMFITKVEATPGTVTTQNRLSVSASSTPAGLINTQNVQFSKGNDVNNQPPNQVVSTRVDQALFQTVGGTDPIAPSSYASYQPGGTNTTGPTSYKTFTNNGNGIEGNFARTGASDVLDLYQLTPGSGAAPLLGIFQFNDGQLLFDSTPNGDSSPLTAVPEPTTLGVGLGLIGVAFASRRRRAAAFAV